MTPLPRIALLISTLLMVPLSACGGGSGTAGADATLRVVHATVEVPANPDVAAVRFVVDNATSHPDTLTGVSSPAAETVEVHRSVIDDEGRGTMEPVHRLPIPARSTVTFEPGGLHVMLTGLHGELVAGESIELDVSFAETGTRQVTVAVVPFGSTPLGDGAPSTEEHDHAG